MIKVVISGYGKMGHMVEKELERRGIPLVEASEDITAIDPEKAKDAVCIDFTWPEAFRANYPFIAKHFKAAVVGTTGWNDIADDVKKTFEENGFAWADIDLDARPRTFWLSVGPGMGDAHSLYVDESRPELYIKQEYK